MHTDEQLMNCCWNTVGADHLRFGIFTYLRSIKSWLVTPIAYITVHLSLSRMRRCTTELVIIYWHGATQRLVRTVN